MKKKFEYFSLLKLLGILIFGYFGISFYFLHSNDSQNRVVIKERTSWINFNKEKLLYIYTDVFPTALDCSKKDNYQGCDKDVRAMIDDNLASILGSANSEVGRLPIYFIRIKNQNTFEKLYQDGKYYKEKVDTNGERMVIKMLQGELDPFNYPQYNCCGGDDFLPKIPIFNLFLPIRRYLNDFPSEIEHIYLIQNEKNEIAGALIYLYGD